MKESIQPGHLARTAVVYLRQSSLRQVEQNQESTTRQYALKQRAVQLGWAEPQIEVIDEDLGRSGTGTEWRSGFKRLLSLVAERQAGAIFALEVSRFSRSCSDWHHLLELCGWSDVLIVDEHAVYSPCDAGDRLVLGLQGQMSEAERYWMRLRLEGGRTNKARRGALFHQPPSGYRWDEGEKRLVLDPDESVREAIRGVFTQYRILGSAGAVHRYLLRNGLRLPSLEPQSGKVEWRKPLRQKVLSILKNPTYAGCYVFGRRRTRKVIVKEKLVRISAKEQPAEAWSVVLKDWHPAYIGWEEYVANRKKLRENAKLYKGDRCRPSAREGGALLQGMVLCGRCGLPMHTDYVLAKRDTVLTPRYLCDAPEKMGIEGRTCWSVRAARIDQVVEEAFLRASQPPEVELGLAVAREAQRMAADLERQWKTRLDLHRHDARLAQRRYEAVDPGFRTVARNLEQAWEEKLVILQEAEEAYEEARRVHRVDLNEADHARIRALARELPAVWHAPSTTPSHRKNLLRILVRQVTLVPLDIPDRMVRVRILWETGTVTEAMVPHRGLCRNPPPSSLSRLRELFDQGLMNDEIAATLNQEGHTTGWGPGWTAMNVLVERRRLELRRSQAEVASRLNPRRSEEGWFSLKAVAERLEVTPNSAVRLLRQSGVTRERIRGARNAAWYRLEESDFERMGTFRRSSPAYVPPGLKNRPLGHCSLNELSERFNIPPSRLYSWVEKGLLVPAIPGRQGRRGWYKLDEQTVATIENLENKSQKKTRHPKENSHE